MNGVNLSELLATRNGIRRIQTGYGYFLPLRTINTDLLFPIVLLLSCAGRSHLGCW